MIPTSSVSSSRWVTRLFVTSSRPVSRTQPLYTSPDRASVVCTLKVWSSPGSMLVTVVAPRTPSMPQTRTSGGRMLVLIVVGHFAQESVRRLLPVHFVDPETLVVVRITKSAGSPGLVMSTYASDDARLKSLACPPTLTLTRVSWTRLVYGALDVPRSQAWKIPLSQPDVVTGFQICV